MEEDSEAQQQQQPGGLVNGHVPNGDVREETTKTSEQPKRKLKMTYEQYRQIANMIVHFMRSEEDKQTDEGK